MVRSVTVLLSLFARAETRWSLVPVGTPVSQPTTERGGTRTESQCSIDQEREQNDHQAGHGLTSVTNLTADQRRKKPRGRHIPKMPIGLEEGEYEDSGAFVVALNPTRWRECNARRRRHRPKDGEALP